MLKIECHTLKVRGPVDVDVAGPLPFPENFAPDA